MYTLSNYWNPKYSPTDYVQCIAFAYMAYNMADKPIRKVKGNAIAMAGKDWKCALYQDGKCMNWQLVNNEAYNDQFTVYESGVSTEPPKVGDLMVWKDDPSTGHVGIAVKIVGEFISVANSNSNQPIHLFELKKTEYGKYKIQGLNGSRWCPDYWSKMK